MELENRAITRSLANAANQESGNTDVSPFQNVTRTRSLSLKCALANAQEASQNVTDGASQDQSTNNTTDTIATSSPSTTRTSGRTLKRTRRDSGTHAPPAKRQAGGSTASPKVAGNPEKPGRSVWSQVEKTWFFDALCESGKDFDAIHNFMAARFKRVKGAGGAVAMLCKNKDQVRHFYYRTWHNIMCHIPYIGEPIKKSAIELYGLINYAEIRRRMGCFNPVTMGMHLQELFLRGCTVIKSRKKTHRIRTPLCKALKALNNLTDLPDQTPKVPSEICVELRPRNNAAFARVQAIAQNPRVRVRTQPQKRLSTVLQMLQKRWQPTERRQKQALLNTLGTLVTDLPADFCQVPVCAIKIYPEDSITEVKILPMDHQTSSDVSFHSYRKKMLAKYNASKSKETVPEVPNGSSSGDNQGTGGVTSFESANLAGGEANKTERSEISEEHILRTTSDHSDTKNCDKASANNDLIKMSNGGEGVKIESCGTPTVTLATVDDAANMASCELQKQEQLLPASSSTSNQLSLGQLLGLQAKAAEASGFNETRGAPIVDAEKLTAPSVSEICSDSSRVVVPSVPPSHIEGEAAFLDNPLERISPSSSDQKIESELVITTKDSSAVVSRLSKDSAAAIVVDATAIKDIAATSVVVMDTANITDKNSELNNVKDSSGKTVKEDNGDSVSQNDGSNNNNNTENPSSNGEVTNTFKHQALLDEKGWTVETVGMVTIGELYLMMGCPATINLSYEFVDSTNSESENPALNSLLSKFIDVLTVTIGDMDKLAALTSSAASNAVPTIGGNAVAAGALGSASSAQSLSSATATRKLSAGSSNSNNAATSTQSSATTATALNGDTHNFTVPKGVPPKALPQLQKQTSGTTGVQSQQQNSDKIERLAYRRPQRIRLPFKHRNSQNLVVVQRTILPHLPNSNPVRPNSVLAQNNLNGLPVVSGNGRVSVTNSNGRIAFANGSTNGLPPGITALVPATAPTPVQVLTSDNQLLSITPATSSSLPAQIVMTSQASSSGNNGGATTLFTLQAPSISSVQPQTFIQVDGRFIAASATPETVNCLTVPSAQLNPNIQQQQQQQPSLSTPTANNHLSHQDELQHHAMLLNHHQPSHFQPTLNALNTAGVANPNHQVVVVNGGHLSSSINGGNGSTNGSNNNNANNLASVSTNPSLPSGSSSDELPSSHLTTQNELEFSATSFDGQLNGLLSTPIKKVGSNGDDRAPTSSITLLTSQEPQWLNGDSSNMSFGTLLSTLESPMKTTSIQQLNGATGHNSNVASGNLIVLQSAATQDSNSMLESTINRLAPDVDTTLQSLLNDSSVEYVAKFADLAAQISSSPLKTPPCTPQPPTEHHY